MRLVFLVVLSILCAPGVVHAASMIHPEETRKVLGDAPATRIIDARGVAARSLTPIAGALAADGIMALDPGIVLLVAPKPEAGLLAAAGVEAAYAGVDVRVIEGGYETLREITGGRLSGTMPGFVIPTDTCAVGPVLRVYGDEMSAGGHQPSK